MKNSKHNIQKQGLGNAPVGATFLVTCVLNGALSSATLAEERSNYSINTLNAVSTFTAKQQLENYKDLRDRYRVVDEMLHQNKELDSLSSSEVARGLLARIESFHMRYYKLLALTIMPNHFQMLIDTSVQIRSILEPGEVPNDYVHLEDILSKIKKTSSRYIAHQTGVKSENVWESTNFVIYIPNEKVLKNEMSYLANNPVKAGLVKSISDHPFTYISH